MTLRRLLPVLASLLLWWPAATMARDCTSLVLPLQTTASWPVETVADTAAALHGTDQHYRHHAALCLQVRNAGTRAESLLLRLDNARLPHAELLSTEAGAVVLEDLAGIDYPLNAWKHFGGEILLEYGLQPGEETRLLLQVGADQPYAALLQAGSPDAVTSLLYTQNLYAGTLAGIILVLILYMLFLTGVTRDATYFYLSCSTAAVCLLHLNDLGILFPLWPDAIDWNQAASVFFAIGSTIAGIGLARHYLLTEQAMPRADKALRLFQLYLLFLWLPLVFADNLLWQWIFYLVPTLLFMASLVTISLLRIRSGYTPARLYLFAVSLPLLAGVFIALSYLNQFSPSPMTRLLQLATTALQLVLFALALGERINWLNQQRELSRQQALLAETEAKAKKNFLAHISHELRTPLVGILGLAELARKNPLYASNQALVNGLEQSARHLLDTTNLLLDHARLDAGKWARQATAFNPALLLDHVLASFRSQAARKQLALTRRIEPGMPLQVEAEEDLIRRILEQLIDNAIKFTADGGILVTAVLEKRRDSHALRFDIIDTGKGIDEDYKPRIFELFELADTSTTRSPQGLGLGLSLCRKFCELAGGEIGCESNTRQGTVFWFSLPCQPLAALPASPAAPAARTTAARAGHHWLVAEDDETLQLVLAARLEAMGIPHTVFPNGKPLLAAYEAQHNDIALVLLDWNMPVCNARQAIAGIRSFEAQHNLPPVRIAVLSAYDRHSARDMIDLPADIAVLQKPLSETELASLLT